MTASLVHLPELGELLLNAGASVDPRNNALTTPLFSACKCNNLFLAKILIDRGKAQWYITAAETVGVLGSIAAVERIIRDA